MSGVRSLSGCVCSTDGLGIAFHCFSQDLEFHPGECRDQLDTPECSLHCSAISPVSPLFSGVLLPKSLSHEL